jgi:CheY-like chemotaxis protein
VSAPGAAVGAQVVVCEDDPPTLELLCDHLHADRYVALPAPTASDALRLCHFKAPDLLLLDLRLPDASGLDVLREIRASEGSTGRYDPTLPVIVLSGRVTEADRLRGFDEGADDYMAKPSASLSVDSSSGSRYERSGQISSRPSIVSGRGSGTMIQSRAVIVGSSLSGGSEAISAAAAAASAGSIAAVLAGATSSTR